MQKSGNKNQFYVRKSLLNVITMVFSIVDFCFTKNVKYARIPKTWNYPA